MPRSFLRQYCWLLSVETKHSYAVVLVSIACTHVLAIMYIRMIVHTENVCEYYGYIEIR